MTDEFTGEPGEAPDGVFDPRWGHPDPDPDHPARPARYVVRRPQGGKMETDNPDDGEILQDRYPE